MAQRFPIANLPQQLLKYRMTTSSVSGRNRHQINAIRRKVIENHRQSLFGTDDLSIVSLVLQDSIGWLAAFAGAGCGWLLFLALPPMFGKVAEAQSALRMRRVRRDQEQLVEEWGKVVTGAER